MLANPALQDPDDARAGADPRLAKSEKRRREIVASLRRCMIEKGYAETSLTDIANTAGLSVSHLLYYYRSKDLILDALCGQVLDKVLLDVTSAREEPPQRRIDVLAQNVFVHGAVGLSELGIFREITALSMHREEIRAQLSRYSEAMMGYLEDLFAKTPRQAGMSALDAAETAAALWSGFVSSAARYGEADSGRARRLFRRALLSLANLAAGPDEARA